MRILSTTAKVFRSLKTSLARAKEKTEGLKLKTEVAIIVGTVTIDHVTKAIARTYLQEISPDWISLIKDSGLNMRYWTFHELKPLSFRFITCCLAPVLGLLLLKPTKHNTFKERLANYGGLLMIGGMLSNACELLFSGGATDFFPLGFGVANFADLGIFGGLFMYTCPLAYALGARHNTQQDNQHPSMGGK